MASGTYAPDPDLHVVDSNGLPVSGGLVWTYLAGTTTPAATYTDAALTTPNANPIVAGSDGRFVAFLAPGLGYKFIYETAPSPPATHGSVLCTRDNVGGIPVSVTTDVAGTAGELLTQGQIVYLSNGAGSKTAGQWYLASAAFDFSSSTAPVVGVAMNTAQAGTQCLVRLSGQITIPGATLIPGGPYYVANTLGMLTPTIPAAPAYTRYLGQALDSATLALVTPTNEARRDVANTFTQKQTLSAAPPLIVLTDTSAPTDAKKFWIYNTTQTLAIDPLNDAETLSQGIAFSVTRSGDITAKRDVYEKGRTTPVGHWTAVPFNAANFVGGSGATWTVVAGNVITNSYTIIGKTLIWQLMVSGSTVAGSSNFLFVTTPVATSGLWFPNPVAAFQNAGTAPQGLLNFVAGNQGAISRCDGGAIVAGTTLVYFTAIIPLP